MLKFLLSMWVRNCRVPLPLARKLQKHWPEKLTSANGGHPHITDMVLIMTQGLSREQEVLRLSVNTMLKWLQKLQGTCRQGVTNEPRQSREWWDKTPSSALPPVTKHIFFSFFLFLNCHFKVEASITQSFTEWKWLIFMQTHVLDYFSPILSPANFHPPPSSPLYISTYNSSQPGVVKTSTCSWPWHCHRSSPSAVNGADLHL